MSPNRHYGKKILISKSQHLEQIKEIPNHYLGKKIGLHKPLRES